MPQRQVPIFIYYYTLEFRSATFVSSVSHFPFSLPFFLLCFLHLFFSQFHILSLLININNKMNSLQLKKFPPQDPNPEELPSTPRKKPQYRDDIIPLQQTPNRIKYKYTVVQKPKGSWLGAIMMVGWMILMLVLFYLGYCKKVADLTTEASIQQQKCQVDFQKNKCLLGLKATMGFCEQKKKCISSDLATIVAAKIDVTFIVGEVIKDFAEGAGLYVCIAGLVMIITLIRRPPAKQVRRQYLQYCH